MFYNVNNSHDSSTRIIYISYACNICYN